MLKVNCIFNAVQKDVYSIPNQYIWEENSAEKFQNALASPLVQEKIKTFNNTNYTGDSNIMIQDLNNILYEAANISIKKKIIKKVNSTAKVKKSQQSKWFDLPLINMKKQLCDKEKLFKKYNKDPYIRSSFFALLKKYRKARKTKYREFRADLIDQLDNLREENPKSYWTLLESLKNSDKKTEKSSNITSTEWAEYFKDLNKKPVTPSPNIIEFLRNLENAKVFTELDILITDKEISDAIHTLKNKKSCGPDSISNEMIKNSQSFLIKSLNHVFNKILSTGNYPQIWANGFITALFKNGSKDDPSNYRGLTVTSCLILNDTNKNMMHIKQQFEDRYVDDNEEDESGSEESESSEIERLDTATPVESYDNKKWIATFTSVYTGRHQNLRNLLLEGNNLRSLPLELGLIKSLNGLNISGNPIEFPPGEIIEKGTNEILKFLREMLLAKSQGRLTTSLNGGTGENGEDSSSSSEDWQDERDLRDWAKIQHRSLSMEDNKSTTTKSSEFGLIPHSAELHRPVSYTEIKQEKTDKIIKAGAMGTVERLNTLTQSVDRRQSANNSVLSWKVNPYPEPPPADYVHFKMNEERQLAKVKDFKEKTDAILQRRKDENVLKEWRHETKIKQQKRQIEIMRSGKKDYTDPVEKAPFDINLKNHIKVMSNEERIKQDVKTAHERLRRQLSPASRQKVEEEKAARIKELEKKIKLHTSSMHARRKQQKGTPQEEMEAARRDLEIVKNLQKDLLKRYQELKAWTTG
ncbi:unnamed protein product [Mytilus edulis]|uniref:Leucine-rich repeat-containing protein 27 n=1 Tax=Mytilus edulis TaxID=6550 RepID=A0A8S3TLU4_MYTED|nr:unnamed protein product [Mytilus edulis]